MDRKLILTIAGAATLWGSGAIAASSTCPDPLVPPDTRTFELTAPVAATCFADGDDNLQGENTDFPGYVFLDKTGATGGLFDGVISAPVKDATANKWSFYFNPGLPATYTNFILGFNGSAGGGGDPITPRWAAFSLPVSGFVCTALAPCTIEIDPTRAGGLSHMNLYGQVNPVPIPAAAWLLGSGLLGLLGIARRRKTGTVAAA